MLLWLSIVSYINPYQPLNPEISQPRSPKINPIYTWMSHIYTWMSHIYTCMSHIYTWMSHIYHPTESRKHSGSVSFTNIYILSIILFRYWCGFYNLRKYTRKTLIYTIYIESAWEPVNTFLYTRKHRLQGFKDGNSEMCTFNMSTCLRDIGKWISFITTLHIRHD